MTDTGWIGSGFDCGCECSFEAGFNYNGNEPAYWGFSPAPVCLLIFSVGNLRNGCTPIEYADADITVELFVNGSPISDPIIITDSAPHGAGYWEKWKPTAGDVYTATVTLVCGGDSGGGGTTLIREFSYTIPDPANTNCNCCTEFVPDYVVIAGLTGIAAPLNGTWALSKVSTCTWNSGAYTGPTDPADPCFGGTQLEHCTIGFREFYYYAMPSLNPAVTVTLPTTSGKIQISFTASYNVWRYDPLTIPQCGHTGAGSCAYYNVTWVYEMDCATGYATLLSRTEGQGGLTVATLNYVAAIPDPTVSLYMV